MKIMNENFTITTVSVTDCSGIAKISQGATPKVKANLLFGHIFLKLYENEKKIVPEGECA